MMRNIDPTNQPKNFEVDVVDPESNSSAGDRFDTNRSHVSQRSCSKDFSAINLSNVNRGKPHNSNLDLSATDNKSILRS